MADTKTNNTKISIKVFVDKLKKRVVYAEADYTFVDILFSFMTLPLGTIVRLLGKHDDTKLDPLGSLKNLYRSLNDLPESYFATEDCKYMLLNPRSLAYHQCRKLQLRIDDTEPMTMRHFECRHIKIMRYINGLCKDFDSEYCIFCGRWLELIVLSGDTDDCVGGGGFVSDIANFIITDDLCVEPSSSATSIRLLKDLGITDMNHLEETRLEMSSYQMLYFLKLALSIDCPFTYLVFSKIKSSPKLAISGQDITLNQYCHLMNKKVSASSKMILEVSLQKSTGKLLFAEANEDFVDFLFGILSIPLGTVVGTLMNGASSISCIDNIFKSISSMSVGRYIKSQDIKDMLLKPHFGQHYSSKNQVFPLSCAVRDSDTKHKDPSVDGGFMKQYGLFMITDDLTITPSSLVSTVNILKKLDVLLEDIEKREVSVGLEEVSRINLNMSTFYAYFHWR
ncbi:uncharacterized protein LOC143533120 [Bidens hawaiensis]|uniref:uncharacterized protein LOC143533120 n=1 Tax=Bidens hawaiensis TaxID=980011 RepID=UPI0040492A69